MKYVSAQFIYVDGTTIPLLTDHYMHRAMRNVLLQDIAYNPDVHLLSLMLPSYLKS